jgi:hypothetical protein
MFWIDKKYINVISPQLKNFKWKTEQLANCSCPICGDSKTNKFKSRFYFINEKNYFRCYCHNCNFSGAFGHFLKQFSPELYNGYRQEVFAEKMLHRKEEEKKVIFTMPTPIFTHDNSPLRKLKKVSQLSSDHIAVQYCALRQIPKEKYEWLYYSDNFGEWVNSFYPDKLTVHETEKRIVIPQISEDGMFFGCTGRTIENDGKRYIAISVDHERKYPHLFNMDKVNKNEKLFIVEGPFDSLFIPNCLAMGTSTLNYNNFPYSNCVFVLDNESRNIDIVRSMDLILDNGFEICIWPDNIKQKDINEMVLAGLNPYDIIISNVYSGLSGKLKLTQWKKVNDTKR